MSADALQEALRIFQEVCDLPSGEREGALRAACGTNTRLRLQVEAMLAKDAHDTQALKVEALQDAPGRLAGELDGSDLEPQSSDLPRQFGQYRIIRKIGEGGMGTVYEARQQSPKRTVAIKVLRPAGNWAALQKRFEHEAFILGRLQHPGIAQIIEAGRQPTSNGDQLYLVMELVRGRDLMKYADSKPLDLRQRLELFVRVCEAVQHAHQKAVIHRDLKPANILVVDDDSMLQTSASTIARVPGQPKILDFGVARLTDSDLQVTTVATGVGQMIGTLPYMSPEQIVGDPREIDTRADVYSLGVVLHELLTGRLPYDLRNRSMLEAARIIREETPARLSTVNRGLRGDLETIVAKALEKEKGRRYQSAADLAADLHAFLDGAPIAAKRDSRWYVLHKTLRRYKLVAALAALLLLLSLGSMITFAVLYRRAKGAAESARLEGARAVAAEATAVRQARRARGLSRFLQEVLHAADSRAVGHDAKIVDALAYAADKLERQFKNDPETRVGALLAMSQTYGDLGEYALSERYIVEAVRLQREMTPEGSSELADLLNQYTTIIASLGRNSEALQAIREAEVLHRKFAPGDSEKLAWDLSNLGTMLSKLGRPDEAEDVLRESVRLREAAFSEEPESQVELACSLHALCTVLYAKRDLPGAEDAAQRACKLFEANYPQQMNPVYPVCLNSLGTFAADRGDRERARTFLTRSVEVLQAMRGADHPETAYALLGLAQFERSNSQFETAEKLYRKALEIRRRVFPSGHPDLGQPLTGLGQCLVKLGRAEEAEPLMREAYEMRKRTAPTAYTTAISAAAYGDCLAALDRLPEAEARMLEGYELYVQSRGPAAAAGMPVVPALLRLYEQTGQLEKRTAFEAKVAAARASASAPAP